MLIKYFNLPFYISYHSLHYFKVFSLKFIKCFSHSPINVYSGLSWKACKVQFHLTPLPLWYSVRGIRSISLINSRIKYNFALDSYLSFFLNKKEKRKYISHTCPHNCHFSLLYFFLLDLSFYSEWGFINFSPAANKNVE